MTAQELFNNAQARIKNAKPDGLALTVNRYPTLQVWVNHPFGKDFSGWYSFAILVGGTKP